LRESVSLAFTAALQKLPARQRAVLLLRDVLAWRASEVAEVLEMTESGVTSALNRARSSLRGRTEAEPAVKVDRQLLERYMRAWETDDMDALVGILREEVRLAMPPSPAWYEGRESVLELLRRWVMPMGPFKMRLTGANLQPAAVLLGVGPDGTDVPLGVHVLALDGNRVAVISQDSESDFSIYFPDVPGCFTRGATRDQACRFAGEMLALHLGRLATNRLPVPSARTLENMQAQPEHRGATLVLVTPIALAAPPRDGSCSG